MLGLGRFLFEVFFFFFFLFPLTCTSLTLFVLFFTFLFFLLFSVGVVVFFVVSFVICLFVCLTSPKHQKFLVWKPIPPYFVFYVFSYLTCSAFLFLSYKKEGGINTRHCWGSPDEEEPMECFPTWTSRCAQEKGGRKKGTEIVYSSRRVL